jgi:hypothetical protein
VRVGVQLGPLGTAATYRPIVPAPGDYDGDIGGMMIGRGNRNTRRKPALVPHWPPQTPHACQDANPGRRGGKPATNCFSYGTAMDDSNLIGQDEEMVVVEFKVRPRYLLGETEKLCKPSG